MITQNQTISQKKAKPTKNLKQSVIDWAGEAPKKPFVWNGKFTTRWGGKKNDNFGLSGDTRQQYCTVYDYRNGSSQTYYLKGVDFKSIKLPPLPETKDIQQEYGQLEDLKDHSYLTKKGVKTTKGLKKKNKELIVPVLDTENKIISWQRIFWSEEKKDYLKRFKPDCPLSAGHHFPIGAQTDTIHVAEGYATAYTIHEITGCQVYCAFSKGNLDNVVSFLIKKHPTKKIVLCCDYKGDETHKTKVNNKNLISICPSAEGFPEKTDFNDHKNDDYERALLFTLDPKEAKLLVRNNIKDIEIKKPVSFYKGILLHHDFNFFYGAGKLGKTRGILWMIKEALKEKKTMCSILSTENDGDRMLAPLLNLMSSGEYFSVLNNQAIKKFPKPGATGAEKIEIFLNRLRIHLKTNPWIECLLIDPLPRFMDWNNETLACLMIDGLRELAKEFKVCVIGVRNEGKNKAYETEALYKGSSGIGDLSRQVNRALLCHRRSKLGKEGDGAKTFVIYTELSSHSARQAYLFKLDVIKAEKDIPVAKPVLIRQLDENIDAVKYLCLRESGQTLSNKILNYLQSLPQKGCSMDDLYDKFGEFHKEESIKKVVYRNFDHCKVAGTTYVQLDQNQRKIKQGVAKKG